MAGEAIVVDRIRARPVRKHAVAGRQIDADGFQRQGGSRPARKTAQRQRQRRERSAAERAPCFPPQATTTAVRSMTLRMNPLGFQLGVSGCAAPLLLVVSADAGAEDSARVAAPALPRNCRRHESERVRNVFSVTMAASPAEFGLCRNVPVHQEPTLSGIDPWCYNSPDR